MKGVFMPTKVENLGTLKNSDAIVTDASVGTSNLRFEMKDDGILIVQPLGALRKEDFDRLANEVDPWIQKHGKLHGIVVNIKKFPGWENFGSFVHHLQFVKSHHKKIEKVAITVDGTLPKILSKIGEHFVKADIQQFPYENVDQAIAWIRNNKL
jgi:hypothetical protein